MGGDDDWDLHAVVRSCRLGGGGGKAAATRDPFSSFLPAASSLDSAAAGEEKGASFDPVLPAPPAELEELCRPFISSPRAVISPLLPSAAAASPQLPRPPRRPPSQIARSKKRKNPQKRVVSHVPADGVSPDMWAWRKYGQKPIKGSPYPRGYYRCSSSKGCPARKQVERHVTDPGMLVINYTAEHNHPVPTHRNSLAGSTRNKFPSSSASAAANANANAAPEASDCAAPRDNPSSSSPPSFTTAAGLSPNTPLSASMEEEEDEWEEGMLLVEDMEVMDEDDIFIVSGSMESSSASALFDDESFFPPPWLAPNNGNAAAAAGGS